MTHHPHGLGLRRGPDHDAEVAALAAELGGRVGLAGVLADLDRRARSGWVPGRAAGWGFRWARPDETCRRWWPQGITTSADPDGSGHVHGREVVLTSAYAKPIGGIRQGARISVVDVTDRGRVRYRHVLLVEAVAGPDGQIDLRPVTVHAGGLAWYGPYLYVAGTARGLRCFRLDDVVAAGDRGDPARLGRARDGRLDTFGHRYLLPVGFSYRAHTEQGVQPLRYSFLSVDRTGGGNGLLVGEYGRGGASTRLARYDADPAGHLAVRPVGDAGFADGVARPSVLRDVGVEGMQGAAVAAGRWYLTTSAGPWRPGSLWAGRPGAFRRHTWSLPPGPEDLAYDPGNDRLWSLSEHPHRRWVFSVDRARFS